MARHNPTECPEQRNESSGEVAPIVIPPPDRSMMGRGFVRVKGYLHAYGQMSGLALWLLRRGMVVLLVLLVLFTLAAWRTGSWWQAFDVMLNIESPQKTASPVITTILSVAGWLVVPGIAGSVAGLVVERGVKAQRDKPTESLFPQV